MVQDMFQQKGTDSHAIGEQMRARESSPETMVGRRVAKDCNAIRKHKIVLQ